MPAVCCHGTHMVFVETNSFPGNIQWIDKLKSATRNGNLTCTLTINSSHKNSYFFWAECCTTGWFPTMPVRRGLISSAVCSPVKQDALDHGLTATAFSPSLTSFPPKIYGCHWATKTQFKLLVLIFTICVKNSQIESLPGINGLSTRVAILCGWSDSRCLSRLR